MAPYWLGSMIFRMAGATYFSITNSSAILEMTGVREIGRKCLFTSVTGFSLGIGVMSACFQLGGSFCSLKEVWRISQTGLASISANVLKNQLGIPSGPHAFRGFNFLRRL